VVAMGRMRDGRQGEEGSKSKEGERGLLSCPMAVATRKRERRARGPQKGTSKGKHVRGTGSLLRAVVAPPLSLPFPLDAGQARAPDGGAFGHRSLCGDQGTGGRLGTGETGREGGREGGRGGRKGDDEVIVAGLAPPTVSFPFCRTGRARAVLGDGELWRAYRGGCGRDSLCIRRREKEGQIPVSALGAWSRKQRLEEGGRGRGREWKEGALV